MVVIGVLAAVQVWQHSYVGKELFRQDRLEPDADTARRMLESQPLDGAALRSLAISFSVETPAGAQLLKLAGAVSRRDLPTQLLLLEQSVQSGNLEAALKHYDTVLTTTPELEAKLIGVLAGAASSPSVAGALVRYSSRPWFEALIVAIAARPSGAPIALSLAKGANLLPQSARGDRIASVLISALTDEGKLPEAFEVANSIGKGQWRKIGFTEASLDKRLGPIGWQVTTGPSASVERITPSAIAISVEPGRFVQVSSRITNLDQGVYRLDVRHEALSPPAAGLRFQIECLGATKSSIGDLSIPAATGPGVTNKAFTVPSNCAFQEWTIWAEGADAQVPSQVLITQLTMQAQ